MMADGEGENAEIRRGMREEEKKEDWNLKR